MFVCSVSVALIRDLRTRQGRDWLRGVVVLAWVPSTRGVCVCVCGLVHIRLADSGRESLLCISSVIIMQAPCGKEAKRAKRPQTGVPVVESGTDQP